MPSRPDGSLVNYDWDEAFCGPLGLSLRTVFGCAYQPFVVLNRHQDLQDPDYREGDRLALNHCTGALRQDPLFDPAALVQGLPGVSIAGSLSFIGSFAGFALPERDYRNTIAEVLRAKLDDLSMICEAVVRIHRDRLALLLEALEIAGEKPRLARSKPVRHGRSRRVGPTRQARTSGKPHSCRSGAFPGIVAGPQEQARGQFNPDQLRVAAKIFIQQGGALDRGCLPGGASLDLL